jgi:medium-chain acyl-[acyl-carrier-protein] hydrolase
MAGFEKTETHRIRSYEVDRNHRLTLERMVNYAQDVAMAQGEELGVGKHHLDEKRLAWVIVKFDIYLDRYPLYREDIQIATRPVGFHKLTADRKFWFSDQEGHSLGTIHSQWVMVDVEKGRMKPIPDWYSIQYGFDFSENEKITYDKLQSPSAWDEEKTFVVQYSDLDFNNHVNNGRYLRWLMDALPPAHLDQYGVGRLQISYKKEARWGDLVSLRSTLPTPEALTSHYELRSSEEETLVQASIGWVKFSE